MADGQLSVLFVCLGNICRSTMAEGVFQSLARKAPYEDLVGKIDSCGTGTFYSGLFRRFPNKILTLPGGYHTGEEPDDRTMSTLADHGVNDYLHYARKVWRPPLDSRQDAA